MRKILILEMIISSFLFLFAIAAVQNPQADPGYESVWSDEFEGKSSDRNDWSHDTGYVNIVGHREIGGRTTGSSHE